MTIGVMFVCFGNICRSPSAEGVFRAMVEQAGLGDKISVDSTGTAAINIGKSPDPRAILACDKVGIDISSLVARQIDDDDYHNNHYIIAMDRQNLMNVTAWKTPHYQGQIRLLMEYHPNNGGNHQLPDPYNSDQDQFYRVIDSIDAACKTLLQEIKAEHQL
ncbi:Putative low molecular weight protein-tyrosine-phosphatase [Sinobacterium norvegicum]|uniref:protein-tyrosine-phosphatase n=1 Tax=Sinobacterium norvegicum TaxID=1641715 RepID=A0ABM9AAM1_9GAMM|nr:low molecular weight protein-tyrosine-phosphatase [Sinobacterium norvegicum]CAH0990269.1 Putative low molecular weight protein-tyrosine-phosphatase [Sinobacterium norvegicum]